MVDGHNNVQQRDYTKSIDTYIHVRRRTQYLLCLVLSTHYKQITVHIRTCCNFKKQDYCLMAEVPAIHIHIQLHNNHSYDTRFRFSTKEIYIQHMSTWCTGIDRRGSTTQCKDRKSQQFIIMSTFHVRAYIVIQLIFVTVLG